MRAIFSVLFLLAGLTIVSCSVINIWNDLDKEKENKMVDYVLTKLMQESIGERQRYLEIKSLPTTYEKNRFIDSIYNKDQDDALGVQKYINTTVKDKHLDSTRILVDYYLTLK